MSLARAEIEAMLDDVFELGSAGVFTRAVGIPADVRAMPRIVDVEAAGDFGVPVMQRGRVISLLKAEAGDERPVKGDSVEILPGGMAMPGVYAILEDATSDDRYQLVWTCRVSDPA